MMEVGVSGRFKFEAINGLTGERRVLADWFDNLILDQGLNRMGVGNTVSRIHVGAGSNPPQVTDTGLQSPVAETNNFQGAPSGSVSPSYGWARATYRFNMGVAAGNISEVAACWATGNASAFSRALIKDGNGNPITLTVLPTDILDVTYELRCYAPPADLTFQATIDGVVTQCVARPSVINSAGSWSPAFTQRVTISSCAAYSGDLGTVNQQPQGSGSTGSSAQLAYVNNSLQMGFTLDWGLAQANFATGIKSIYVQSSCGSWQCSFTPPIAKPADGTKSLRLNGYISWARRP